MIYLLISRQFTYEKKYPAEGHKFHSMISINFKKEFKKKLRQDVTFTR